MRGVIDTEDLVKKGEDLPAACELWSWFFAQFPENKNDGVVTSESLSYPGQLNQQEKQLHILDASPPPPPRPPCSVVPALHLPFPHPNTPPQEQEQQHDMRKSIVVEEGTLLQFAIDPLSRSLVTDFTNQVLNELKIIKFHPFDKRGNRARIPVGQSGLGCRHCDGHNKRSAGRLFPTSLKSLCDKGFILSMHNHLQRCEACPESLKRDLSLCQQGFQVQNLQKPFGSRVQFFEKIWAHLVHPGKDQNLRVLQSSTAD